RIEDIPILWRHYFWLKTVFSSPAKFARHASGALAPRENRTCNDMIPGRWTCEDLEEKGLRQHTGCLKFTKSKG
ncbi:hypothetical protein M8C21_000003, partial [Ambrosia artemisiifolia]